MVFHLLPKHNLQASCFVKRWLIGFFLVVFCLQIFRIFTLNATYDQGLFLQEIWNISKGRLFESTLASELSAKVLFENDVPTIGYRHLAQHFTPLLIIWTPLVQLLGVWSLPLIQVGLITFAGWTLFLLGKEYLPPSLAAWITCSFFTTATVIGPALENFHDLCAIPLLTFGLLLGISRNNKPLYLINALLIPLVREDVGLLSFSIGLWMMIRRPGWRSLGCGLCLYSVIAVLIITNTLMPIFGSELTDRFMQERFSQYLDGQKGGTLDVLYAMLSNPNLVIKEIFTPFGSTFRFLLTLALPLAFMPWLSVDSWLLVLVPLFVALSSQGGNALEVSLRFVLYLVPGIFAGTIFWLRHRPNILKYSLFSRFWKICLIFAFAFALIGNPHRSLSFIIPDSISPWVHIPIQKQIKRGFDARQGN